MSEVRLIDADELVKSIREKLNWSGDEHFNGGVGLYDVLDLIDNAPTVAVDEEIERQREELYQSSKKLFDTARMLGVARPTGEWIHFLGCGVGKAVCSECNQLGEIKKYCGNCGARMKGGAE